MVKVKQKHEDQWVRKGGDSNTSHQRTRELGTDTQVTLPKGRALTRALGVDRLRSQMETVRTCRLRKESFLTLTSGASKG
jgi:hypothetical protein